MKIPKMTLLAALVAAPIWMDASAGDHDLSIQMNGDESRLVQSQLRQDWSEAENHLTPTVPPHLKKFFECCGSFQGPELFKWMDGKSIAVLTQAVTLSLKADYRFTFMKEMKNNLFSLYNPCQLEESQRVLRSYIYASFPEKWLNTVFHADFSFTQFEGALRSFFENNRQGRGKIELRNFLLDHLLTTHAAPQILSLFFERLELEQKEQFLKSSLFNENRLRGFKDNASILSDFPVQQYQVIQHNVWLDLISKMDKNQLYWYVWYVEFLDRKEKALKIFVSRILLQDRAGMIFDNFAYILEALNQIAPDHSNEVLLSIMQDSTGDAHQQAYAMKLYIKKGRAEEVAREICESILQDPKAELTRQLYAIQELIELDPLARAFFEVQKLSTEIWRYQSKTIPIKIRAQIHVAAKKSFASFQRADVEDLYLSLDQNPDTKRYRRRVKFMLLELDTFSQEERAETAKRFDFRMRLALQEPKPLELLMKWGKPGTERWKLKAAKESFPFDPLRAEALLFDMVTSKSEGCDPCKMGYRREALLLLRMFNRTEAVRQAYTLIMHNSAESARDREQAQSWLAADHEVTLLKASGSISSIMGLELTYLLDSLEYSNYEENLWIKIFLHTHSQAQKQTAKNKITQNWLEAHESVALLKDSGSISSILSLELTDLLENLEGSSDEEALWTKIFQHTQSQAQKQIARNKLEGLKADAYRAVSFSQEKD